MSWFFVALLLAIGMLLLMAEMFVIPGLTVVGVGGGLLVGVSIVMSYGQWGVEFGNLVTVLAIAGASLMRIISFKTVGIKRMEMRSQESRDEATALYEAVLNRSKSQPSSSGNISKPPPIVDSFSDDAMPRIGEIGLAFGDIQPMGKMVIDGRIYLVRSYTGDFIPNNAQIKVEEVAGGRVMVVRVD